MYVLIFFGILVRRCGNVVVGERLGYERSGFEVQVRPCVAIFFLFYWIEMISITGQKFCKCLKNGSDRLRKGLLRGQPKIFKAKPGTFKKTRPSPHAQETIPFPTHPPPPPLRPLPGVTGICVSPWYVYPRTHIPSDMCIPGGDTINTDAHPRHNKENIFSC